MGLDVSRLFRRSQVCHTIDDMRAWLNPIELQGDEKRGSN